MLRSKKFISMLLAMIMVLSIACLSASAETQIDTTSRGYQLIDGDVYDLDNNLLIKMDNGFIGDGYTLDPNFTVYYPSNVPVDKDKVSKSSTKATDIFDASADLFLNVDGNQGVWHPR